MSKVVSAMAIRTCHKRLSRKVRAQSWQLKCLEEVMHWLMDEHMSKKPVLLHLLCRYPMVSMQILQAWLTPQKGDIEQ